MLLCQREMKLYSLQVQKGHFVYDPFVGTGSILVAASHFGAVTIGADIDIRVVRDGHVVLGGQVYNVNRVSLS